MFVCKLLIGHVCFAGLFLVKDNITFSKIDNNNINNKAWMVSYIWMLVVNLFSGDHSEFLQIKIGFNMRWWGDHSL